MSWFRKKKDYDILYDEIGNDEELENVPFERIRRITGYLNKIEQFNSAKQKEVGDRKKHGGE